MEGCRSGRCRKATCERGAGAGDHGGSATDAESGKCDARASPTASPLSVLSRPLPCHTTCGGRGGRGAVAHRYPRSVSSPSCEGRLPLRSLLLRYLREGRRSGVMGERRRTRRVASATRGLPLRAAALCRLPPPTQLRRLGGGGAEVAHSSFRAVSSPSCVGTLPLRSFSSRYLREGRRSEIMGERRRTQSAASATRVLPLPAAIPSAP